MPVLIYYYICIIPFTVELNSVFFTVDISFDKSRNGQQTMRQEDKLKTPYYMDITVSAFSQYLSMYVHLKKYNAYLDKPRVDFLLQK